MANLNALTGGGGRGGISVFPLLLLLLWEDVLLQLLADREKPIWKKEADIHRQKLDGIQVIYGGVRRGIDENLSS